METIRIIFAWTVYLIVKTLLYIFIGFLWCILAGLFLLLLGLNFLGFAFGPIVGFIWLFIAANILGVFFEIISELFGGLVIFYASANQKINLFFTDTEQVPS
jgi:hypothetical protein